ncbi:DMT family transporter [Mucilaginibacter ginkgonis]|uniref:DMT family transporter n=1 Tax=Mucilaginibacter ginkgonis TaxID=2682091 RepID=A0A6I4IMY7_9SPHI|nr:DMT family transporter [Mucilaginibacter ginkgonis]QQL51264.1 DMT family transporter [Mucilaginibacter ginkgonis]
MQSNSFWLFAIIVLAGIIEACGPPMNASLFKHLQNPWIAGLVCFLPVLVILLIIFLFSGSPLPSFTLLQRIPWWAYLGGIACCIAIVLTFVYVDKVGVGTFAGLIITSNLIMSVVIDKYGWFGTEIHPLSIPRLIGACLMIAGIFLISKY